MKADILEKVILPIMKGVCEAAEMAGVTVICYAEIQEGLTSGVLTHHVEPDASPAAQLVLNACHVDSFDGLAARCKNVPELVEGSKVLEVVKVQKNGSGFVIPPDGL